MEVTQRIPTAQYAYVEFTKDYDSVEDAMADHKRMVKLYNEEGSLSHREWVAIRNNMVVTGECDPNIIDQMSAAQRWFINELKLALRAHTAEEPVIN